MLNCLLTAVCLNLSAGVTHANPQDCGIWYVCGPQTPYTLGLDSPSVGLGVETEHWRAGYEFLGRFSSEAVVGALPDGSPCGGCKFEHYHGSGKVHGFYGEYIHHMGAFRMEGGLWLYHSSWEENVPDWQNVTGAPPQSTTVSQAGWHPGVILGVGYDIGRYTLSLNARMAANSHDSYSPSIVKSFATNFSIRYSW